MHPYAIVQYYWHMTIASLHELRNTIYVLIYATVQIYNGYDDDSTYIFYIIPHKYQYDEIIVASESIYKGHVNIICNLQLLLLLNHQNYIG